MVKNLCENSKMQRHATILQEHLKHSVQNHDWHVRLDTYVLTSEWMLDGWDGFLSGSQTKKMNKSSWTPKAQLSLSVCLSVWLSVSLSVFVSPSPLPLWLSLVLKLGQERQAHHTKSRLHLSRPCQGDLCWHIRDTPLTPGLAPALVSYAPTTSHPEQT